MHFISSISRVLSGSCRIYEEQRMLVPSRVQVRPADPSEQVPPLAVQGAIQEAVLMLILSQAPASLPPRKRDDFSRDQHVFSPLSHHEGGL